MKEQESHPTQNGTESKEKQRAQILQEVGNVLTCGDGHYCCPVVWPSVQRVQHVAVERNFVAETQGRYEDGIGAEKKDTVLL